MDDDCPSEADLLRFRATLTELIELLSSYDQTDWTHGVEQCRTLIDAGDEYGVDRFLQGFGGMGSLNDIVLQRTGQDRSGPDVPRDNLHLQALLEESHRLALRLRRVL